MNRHILTAVLCPSRVKSSVSALGSEPRRKTQSPRRDWKTLLLLATSCAALASAQAEPYKPEQLQLRLTVQPYIDMNVGVSSMFNPRFFDGDVYASQINTPCFARYAAGSVTPEATVNNVGNNTLEHRMVAPFRGTNSTSYMLGSSSAIASAAFFTRYDFDGNNPVSIDTPETQLVDAFDWVDANTIIYADYTSGNRNRLYLATVVAEPFSVTLKPAWNSGGYVTTSVTKRIRNVRVGDVYSGYAYYGDAGENANPKFYALNLSTGAETLLGNLGTLTGTGSFGLWTVLERGGYLYVQTTDNGVFVYKMTGATTLGALYATYTKEQLDLLTGSTTQYYGLDVTSDGKRLLLGNGQGSVFELEGIMAPYASQQVQLTVTMQPAAELGVGVNSMFNPRVFDGKVYANQINASSALFGRYAMGATNAEVLVNNSGNNAMEHRMVAPFRGASRLTYMLGSGSAAGPASTFTRYDFDGNNANTIEAPDSLVPDAFDWADDDTIIYAVYSSGNRTKLYLADVVAEPFAITKSTAWNADGFVTTSASTRIRNVRRGDLYRGFAYYGDAGQNTNPKFYAINLATGAETLLGNLGTLTGSGSFGIWTVVERDGYLYVQTTDNGIQIYSMANATTLGQLYGTVTKEQLDAITGGSSQYFGLDLTQNARTWVLGGVGGKVFQLDGGTMLAVAKAGANVVLSWPTSAGSMVIQSTSSLTGSFADMAPQPTIVVSGDQNTASVPATAGNAFFRLRKSQ